MIIGFHAPGRVAYSGWTVSPSVCLSVNVGHNFCNIEDCNLIFGMHVYLMELHSLSGERLRSSFKVKGLKTNSRQVISFKRGIIAKPVFSQIAAILLSGCKFNPTITINIFSLFTLFIQSFSIWHIKFLWLIITKKSLRSVFECTFFNIYVAESKWHVTILLPFRGGRPCTHKLFQIVFYSS